MPDVLWNVPVTWSMYGEMKVTAKTKDEAVEKVQAMQALPSEQGYIEDSLNIETNDVTFIQ